MLSIFQRADIIDFVEKIFQDMNSGSIEFRGVKMNNDIFIETDDEGEISCCRVNKVNKKQHEIETLHTFNVKDYNEEEDLIEDIEKALSEIINNQNKSVNKMKQINIKNTQQSLLNILKDNLISSINNKNNNYTAIDRKIYNSIFVDENVIIELNNKNYLTIYYKDNNKLIRYGKPINIKYFNTQNKLIDYIKNEVRHIELLDHRINKPFNSKNIYNNIDWKNYANYIKQNKMKKNKKSLLHLYVKRPQQTTQKAELELASTKAKVYNAFDNRKKFIKMKKQQDKRNKKINEQFIKQQVESLQNEQQEVESLTDELKSKITHKSTNNPIIQDNTREEMKAGTFFKKLERFNEICLKNTLKPKDHYRLTY